MLKEVIQTEALQALIDASTDGFIRLENAQRLLTGLASQSEVEGLIAVAALSETYFACGVPVTVHIPRNGVH